MIPPSSFRTKWQNTMASWAKKMGFSPEVHDTISQWQGALKQQRDDLKKMIDNGFAQWTALFTPPYVKPAPVAQKTTPKKAEAKPETA